MKQGIFHLQSRPQVKPFREQHTTCPLGWLACPWVVLYSSIFTSVERGFIQQRMRTKRKLRATWRLALAKRKKMLLAMMCLWDIDFALLHLPLPPYTKYSVNKYHWSFHHFHLLNCWLFVTETGKLKEFEAVAQDLRQTRSSEKILRKPSSRSIILHWCHLPCSFILTFMDVICNVHLNIMLPLNQLHEKPYISQKSVKIKGQKYGKRFHHGEKAHEKLHIRLFQLIHYPITITIT